MNISIILPNGGCALKGANDLEILEAYYDRESVADPKLRQIDNREFRNYYGLRASVAASRGSHDEWNIVRLINERRRHDEQEFDMNQCQPPLRQSFRTSPKGRRRPGRFLGQAHYFHRLHRLHVPARILETYLDDLPGTGHRVWRAPRTASDRGGSELAV